MQSSLKSTYSLPRQSSSDSPVLAVHLNNLPLFLPELQFPAKSTMSQQQSDIQERIAAARREAEQLKEKIRAKRESSADTSRSYNSSFALRQEP